VLEVGLGGRLDATTVGTPAVTVLARIDLDHREVLGDTLAAIAAEKAAIIRSGVAISAAQAPEAAEVLAARARAVGVPLLVEDRELHVRVTARTLEGQTLDCAGPDWRLEQLALPLLGAYQPSNALLAVATARTLGVADAAVRAGLARARWPGRFEVFRSSDRVLVLDGAHNPAGAQALAASLTEWFGGTPVTLVFGALRDKDARGMLAALAPRACRLILTASSSARAASPEMLAAQAPAGAAVELAASVDEALRLAAREPRSPILCVAGSLSLLGDLLRRAAGDKPWSLEKPTASMGSFI
jgi:dihydrofolate synthase/folylpolyglutamate synthase